MLPGTSLQRWSLFPGGTAPVTTSPSVFRLRNEAIQGTISDVGHESSLRRPRPVMLNVFAVGQVFDGQYQFPGRGDVLQEPYASLDFPLGIGTVIFIAGVEQVLLADAVDDAQITGFFQQNLAVLGENQETRFF